MKKIFTTIVMAVLMMAAIPAKAGINFGIKGGLNVTNFSFSISFLSCFLNAHNL